MATPKPKEFAEKHKGCLYTVGQIMDVDVPNAKEIAVSHDTQYRYVTKPIYERIEAEALSFVGALLRYGWTLNERQVRDSRHIIAARITGALFFVA